MQHSASFFLANDDDTARLGSRLSPHLKAGDVLLLEGPIGAGKTSLARAIIQSRLAAMDRIEDVPSPTYTLVQTYDLGEVEIWHADLYRLGHSSELFELGLDDAFEAAIVLVEWPDRLGDLVPTSALKIRIDVDGDGRRVTFRTDDPKWYAVINELSDG